MPHHSHAATKSTGWRLPNRLGRHKEKVTVVAESVTSTSPNRLRFPADIILTVDPSQSLSPQKVLGFFHLGSEKGNPINDEHHGKTNLAMGKQELARTFTRRTRQQRRGRSPQTNPLSKSKTVDIEESTHRSTEKTAPRPAVTTAIAPVQKKLYPVGAFGSLAAVIMLIARAVQVSVEMVGSAMIGMLSALAQAIINVSPKKSGVGCPVTINLLIIALSADRKSSTISAVIKPILAAISRGTDCRRHMLIQDVTVDGMVIGLIDRCHSQLLIAPEGASLFGGHAMSPDNLGRFMGNVSSLFSGEALTRTRAKEHSYAEDRRLSLLVFVQPVIAMDFLGTAAAVNRGMS